jgi:hypothetical protein
MAKKIHFTAQQENEIALIQEETGMSRKSAIRKLQRRAKLAAKKVKAPKAAKPKSETPRTEAGSARAIGIALYKMAGRPSKKDFLHVFGDMGAKWTWEARAKAVGLRSAEAAAEKFQAMLRKPAGSCLVESEPKQQAAKQPAVAGA